MSVYLTKINFTILKRFSKSDYRNAGCARSRNTWNFKSNILSNVNMTVTIIDWRNYWNTGYTALSFHLPLASKLVSVLVESYLVGSPLSSETNWITFVKISFYQEFYCYQVSLWAKTWRYHQKEIKIHNIKWYSIFIWFQTT